MVRVIERGNRQALELQRREPIIVGCKELRRNSRQELLAEREIRTAETAGSALRRDVRECSARARQTRRPQPKNAAFVPGPLRWRASPGACHSVRSDSAGSRNPVVSGSYVASHVTSVKLLPASVE